MKIKSHTAIILLIITIISKINKIQNISISNTIKSKNSNAMENNKFEITANFHNKLNSQAKLFLKNSFSNLINFTFNERLGGYPPVKLNENALGKGPVYYNGWGKLMKFENVNNPKKYIREFTQNKQNPNHKNEFYFTVNDRMVSAYYSDQVLIIDIKKRVFFK